jgi:hypothetical protein
MTSPAVYPWYTFVNGSELEQGDILLNCPVFIPADDVLLQEDDPVAFEWEDRDVVVMTQSCDLEKGHEKVTEVLLCGLWQKSEIRTGHLATPKGLEDARRGHLPASHLLAPCELPGFQRDISVVDFRRVYSLPVEYLRRLAVAKGDRIRILPPYREHLAQAFARYFMRVGLPVAIPPLK